MVEALEGHFIYDDGNQHRMTAEEIAELERQLLHMQGRDEVWIQRLLDGLPERKS